MSPRPTFERAQELRVAVDAAAVVVRGPFNPAIFSPAWFSDAELVGKAEVEDSEIEVISPDVTSFRLGWLRFTATRDTLQLATEEIDELPRLRDAAIGVLKILDHQPVSVLGINRDTHTLVGSSDSLNHLGDRISPKEIWLDFLDTPGVRSITMWGARTDKWRGRINVRVEPSVLIPMAAFVSVNDHYELVEEDQEHTNRGDSYGSGDGPVEPASEKRQTAIEILIHEWDASMARATIAHAHLMAFAEGATDA
ncbi:hypothetical protein ACFDTO_20840 [Microbacteriaceae bacterium 4G12]